MANTYTQIYMHIVFAVSHREAMIDNAWMDKLYAYMVGICHNRKHFVHAIGGTADHVHLLVGMNPSDSVSDLVKNLKGTSSHWINENYYNGRFSWQSGYGAFAYSRSLIPEVKRYVENQREHHRRISFREEVERMFQNAGIEYNPEYMMYGFLQPEDAGGIRQG